MNTDCCRNRSLTIKENLPSCTLIVILFLEQGVEIRTFPPSLPRFSNWKILLGCKLDVRASQAVKSLSPLPVPEIESKSKWNLKSFLYLLKFFSNFNIFVGMLLGPNDLFESSEDIMFCISDLLVGLRKKEFWVLLFSSSEKCLCEGLIYFFVSSANFCKIFFKDIWNLYFIFDGRRTIAR